MHFFRPAGLVHVALTSPVPKGVVFPFGLPCVSMTRLDVFEKTVTFAQEQKVYFLTLCNKTTADGPSAVSPVLFMFIY